MSHLARIRSLGLALVAAVALTGVVATGASAKVLKLTGQTTTITPSAAAKTFLANNGVSVTPVLGATASGGSVTFKITGGRVNSKTLFGVIRHSGGLKFTKNKRSAVLRALEVVRNGQGVKLTAIGDVRVSSRLVIIHRRGHTIVRRVVRFAQRRVLVANVVNVSRTNTYGGVTVKGDLKLSDQAARLVNRALGSHLTGGADLGSGQSVLSFA